MTTASVSSPIAALSPCALDQMPTPALVIDRAIVQRNVNRLATYAKAHGLGIRPHTKTHKSHWLAQMQLEAGAIGLTAAKVGEVEEMMQVADDLLLAYPAVDRARGERLGKIARHKTVHVAVDGTYGIKALAAAAAASGSVIGMLVDVDVGMGRTGVATPVEALALAQLIEQTPGARLDGIFCYPGHVWTPVDQQTAPLALVAEKLQAVIDLWARHGLSAKIVSGGSTPTAYQSHLVKPYTEIRPGTYVFNDMNTVRGGYCEFDDCAARIICTVVSDAVKDQVVIDGGTKTFSSDLCIPARESGHGYVVEFPQARLMRLSEEHGQLDVSMCEMRPKVGDRVSLIPNHICPCVNLQNAIWLQTNNEVQPMLVNARGRLS